MESLRLVVTCWAVLDAWTGRKTYREFHSAIRSMEDQLRKEEFRATSLQLAADELLQVWKHDGRYHEFLVAGSRMLNILNDLEQARQG